MHRLYLGSIQLALMAKAMDRRYLGNILIHIMNDGTVFLLPSVLPLITIEYGLTYAMAGAVSSIIPLCLGILQTPIGRYGERFQSSLMLRVGIMIVGAGALMVGTLPQLFLPGLFLMGIGGSVYHPIGYAYTSRIVGGGKAGVALGIQSSSGDVGILAAYLMAGPMALIGGWRLAFVFWGALSFAAFLASAFLLGVREGDRGATGGGGAALFRREALIVIALFAILGAVHRILSTFLPTIFFLGGLGIAQADAATALYIGIGIAGGIIGGKLTDSHGPRRTALAFYAATAAALLIIYKSQWLLLDVALIAIMGISVLGIYPPLYYAMREITGGRLVGTAYGLLLSLGMVSGIGGVTIGGYLMDYSPHIVYPFAAALALGGAIIAFALPRERQPSPAEPLRKT